MTLPSAAWAYAGNLRARMVGNNLSNDVTSMCRKVQLSLPRKAVLMCLADRSDDNGIAWPSVAGIAEWTCAGRTTVIEAVRWLEQNGFVTISKSLGRNSRFELNLVKLRDLNQDDDRCANRTSPPAVLVREADPTRPPAVLPPVRQPDHTSAPAVPEASISISEAPAKHQEARASKSHKHSLVEQFPEFLAGIDPQVLADWEALRKKQRAPVSQTVLSGLANKARLADMPLVSVLRMMVERNWQGFEVHWLDANKNSGRKSVQHQSAALMAGARRHHQFDQRNYEAGVSADGKVVLE